MSNSQANIHNGDLYDQLQQRKRFYKPVYDPERIEVEPQLRWIDSAITPFTRTKAGVYDIANRRWYELNVERVVTDEDWIINEVGSQIHSSRQHFNVISIGEDNEVSLEFKEDISRAIFDMITYDGSLKKTSLDTLRKKKYLSGHIDTCEWNGQKVAYKCIEFSGDVETIQREINLRERLGPGFMGVVQILAVVIDSATQYVNGILLPLYDGDLETFANDADTRLRLSDLHSLIKTINQLHLLGITHGDICERNVVINVTCDHISRDIALVDFGEVAPEYEGDFKMTAALLFWCAEHFIWTAEEDAVIKAAAETIQQEDYEKALRILSSVDSCEG